MMSCQYKPALKATQGWAAHQTAINLPIMSCAALACHVAMQTSQLQKMPSTKSLPQGWCVWGGMPGRGQEAGKHVW